MHGCLLVFYVVSLVVYAVLATWMCVWLLRGTVGPKLIRATIRHLPPRGRGMHLADLFTARYPPDDRVFRSRERSGMLLHCDLRDESSRLAYYCGVAEPGTVEWMRGWLRPGDTYVDVGADIGSLISIAAEAVGPTGTIVAFEPHPRRYKLLKAAVHDASRPLPRIIAYPAAVGEGRGTAPIYDRESFTVTAEVPLVPLDAVIADQPIRLLKIDAEAFEEEALRGGRRALDRCDAVLIKFNSTVFARFGSSTENASELLEAHGLRPADAMRTDGRSEDRIFLRAYNPRTPVAGRHTSSRIFNSPHNSLTP